MKIIAHRGYSEEHPENSLKAFTEAVKKGADAIEFDIHFSLDKKCIVNHNYLLTCSNGDEKLISDLNSSDINKINEKILFLEEVLQVLKKNVRYEIELKGYTKEFINEVIQIVAQYNLLKNIEFTSPHVYVLSYLKHICPSATIGMFVNPLPTWMNIDLGRNIIKNNAILGSINVIHIPLKLLTREYVEEIHKENIVVHASDCNTEEEIEKAYQLGVDQLSTDRLIMALQIKKLHEK